MEENTKKVRLVVIKEFDRLHKYASTPESAKPTLKRVRQYLSTHLAHVQYHAFKKLGVPIGSGMVEGFNHLLH
jgi:hypothetical protein